MTLTTLNVTAALGAPFLWIVALTAAAPRAAAQEWPRFRGPDGAGISAAKGIPVTFDAQAFDWRITLPGVGHSSPVLWGDRIFVTCATERDAGAAAEVVRRLVCVGAADGKVLWTREQTAHPYARNGDNSYASPTCAADAGHVYVCWNHPDDLTVAAFTHDGEPAWERKLGPYVTQHGGGASPVVFDDMVVMPNDQDGAGFLVALDAVTGKDRWRIPRRAGKFSASTPCVLRPAGGGRPQLVFTTQEHGITGVDPAGGTVLWEVPGAFDSRTVGSPVAGASLIFATCGEGPRGHVLDAVRPPSTPGASPEVAYRITDNAPYVPTPLVVGDLLFYWTDTGTVTCADAATGDRRWQQRLATRGGYFASPVCVDGKVYNVSKTGEVVVFAAAPDAYHELGRSALPIDRKDKVHATPAVANGRIIFRSYNQLMAASGK